MKESTKLWQLYQEGLNYQRRMGFASDWPKFERFKAGKQWPEVTEATRNLPRPVFNITDFTVRIKRANVLNQHMKLIYSPAEISEGNESAEAQLMLPAALSMPMGNPLQERHARDGAEDFTDFADFIWADLDQDELNDDFIDDAATLGTGILHYYWDSDVSGGLMNRFKGELRGEVIDPVNIFVANPQERRVQKQEWVMISGREDVGALRKLAAENGVRKAERELIVADNETGQEGYDAARQEMDKAAKCTVLTRYYRINGEVVFDRATRNVLIQSGVPLTPRPEKLDFSRFEQTADLPEPPEPDVPEAESVGAYRMTLYPLVVMCWSKRKKSFFGSGEVETIIPNQTAINFNIGMMLLSVQQTAWPKMLVKTGALQQTLTNTPGELVTDYSSGGDGLKYLQPPIFPGVAVGLTDKVIEYTRMLSGVNEVTSGDAFTANMAASAIIALQNQAKQPIESIQKRFYRAVREIGRIWEQFFKAYYIVERSITVPDGNGKLVVKSFLGERYRDVEYNLDIDVGPAAGYSESLAQATLDKLFDRGHVTLEQYIELAPKNTMPFREQLKKMMAAGR